MSGDEAPGWDAINRGLEELYGAAEPFTHWATILKWSLGGPDPLDGISVYQRDTPVPHWHYVTYGLSELYEKETSNPELSGFGFELTARLRRGAEDQPPVFMANFLQNLARYVVETGNTFEPGHSMDLFGPIHAESDTAIRAAMFYADPELQPQHSSLGHVNFVQVVGVTLEERAAIRTWDAFAVQPVLESCLPLLVTDLSRPSLLLDQRFADAIDEGRQRDGSSMGGLFAPGLGMAAARRFPRRPANLTLPATIVDTLCLVLPLRLPFRRSFRIDSSDCSLTFTPGSACELQPESAPHWALTLTDEQVRELADTLQPRAGTYSLRSAPTLAIHVTRTAIRDQTGNVISHVG